MLLFVLATTLSLAQTVDSTKTVKTENDSGFVMEKSPMGAFWRSAIIPGWGQFYNESYWKIPIVWGVSAWFIYLWTDRNNFYENYQDLYNISLTESSNGNSNY